MLYQVTSYLKFLMRSTNQHGVHSPFVFDLVTKCFYNKNHFQAYSKLFEYRKQLLNNSSKIKITDLGAGSKLLQKKERRIKNIVKHSGTTFKRSKLLYRLIDYLNCGSILELGTSLGIGTHAMSLANPKNSITTIEGCPNIIEFTKRNLKNESIQNVEFKEGDFSNHLEKLSKNTYDLIFFDGNHQKDATLSYFETFLPSIHNNTVFIFDDIYWSKDMTEAWETIKTHPKVTVTIDSFFWGLVFFRKEQQKEHFTIRV